MAEYPATFPEALHAVTEHAVARAQAAADNPTTARTDSINQALLHLPRHLSDEGLGFDHTVRLLKDYVAPALAPGQAGPHYYGFVTGGVSPAAQ